MNFPLVKETQFSTWLLKHPWLWDLVMQRKWIWVILLFCDWFKICHTRISCCGRANYQKWLRLLKDNNRQNILRLYKRRQKEAPGKRLQGDMEVKHFCGNETLVRSDCFTIQGWVVRCLELELSKWITLTGLKLSAANPAGRRVGAQIPEMEHITTGKEETDDPWE